MNDSQISLCLVFILLTPMAAAALAVINCGLGRSRSAAHILLSSICAFAVAAVVYVAWGFSLQGVAGGPAHVVVIGRTLWNWSGAEHSLLGGVPLVPRASLVALLQVFSVGLAALIPLSAGSCRWRLAAICGSTVLLAGCVYPLFAHWVWGGGWLSSLAPHGQTSYGFVDAAGAGCIQAVGGLTALAMAWILGPRRGKYAPDGMPAAIPAHNVTLILIGCFLAWIGWLGLNSAGSILFAGTDGIRVVLVAINTTLAAAAGGLAAMTVTRLRFGRPDASLTANGWLAGLVASSAGAPWMRPAAALAAGAVAGILIPFAVEAFEFWLAVDDPGGAISVHAVGGIWGLISIPLLAGSAPGSRGEQWLAQAVGIATLLGFVLPLAYLLNWLLDRFYRQRVSPDGERLGMDLFELGAGAYPEFAVYSDEFLPR